MYENSTCLTWHKPFSSGGFFLLATAFYFNLPYNRFTYITFHTQSKRLTNYYTLFPLHWKQLRSWEVCGLGDSWSFAASNSLMHTIHRCTWKSLQFFIIIIMMAWFMRVFQQNALAPSSVYSILPQCIRPHFLSCICVFSFLFTAMHVESLAFCVWEWRRYSIQYNYN